MSDQLLVRHDGRVLRLTLNRADKRNALSAALCETIVRELEAAARDTTVGCVLLDAAGPVFCAGMDLKEATQPGAAEMTAIHERLFTLGLRVAVPIVVGVAGPALGGGVGLMANGHYVVAAQGSTFALTEVRIGMWPYVIFRAMSAAIGERRAVALSLTGRVFSASEALQFGLVHEIAPAVELEDRAVSMAHLIASMSGETVRRGMRFVRESREMDDAAAVRLAERFRRENFASGDFTEGVRAFEEKRRPEWPSQART